MVKDIGDLRCIIQALEDIGWQEAKHPAAGSTGKKLEDLSQAYKGIGKMRAKLEDNSLPLQEDTVVLHYLWNITLTRRPVLFRRYCWLPSRRCSNRAAGN